MIKGEITKYLGVAVVAILLSSCSSDPLNLADIRAATSSESTKGSSIFKRVNQYRVSKGKNALKYSPELEKLARSHSQDMASGKVGFGHKGFGFRFSHVRNLYQMDNVGELTGYSTRSDAIDWIFNEWVKSRGHRRQMVGLGQMGAVAVAKSSNGTTYVTLLMATSRKPTGMQGPRIMRDRFGNPL